MAQLSENGPTGGNSAGLKIACYGAAAALCAVTMAANLKFGLTLGSTVEEKAIYAIASVGGDIFKCTTVVLVIRLWQKRQRWLAGVGTLLGLACLTWSLASAAGFALATREHTAAMHAATSKVIDGWTTTIRRAGEQLALVGQSRPQAVIQSELAGEMVPSAIWKRTRECVELTLPESHSACARVLALRQELATAQSAQALEERIGEARRQLATTPMVAATADPQVAGLAAMIGTEEPKLRRALALLLAILVELGSATGFALTRAATVTPPLFNPPPSPCTTTASTTAPNQSKPPTVVRFPDRMAHSKGRPTATPPHTSLVRWAEQCVRRDRHGCLGARDTYRAYCRWAGDVGMTAVSEAKFGRFLTSNIAAMGGSKAARGQGAFYLGIQIAPVPDPQPVRMAA